MRLTIHRLGGLRHFIGARVGDEHIAQLRALAEASGFTHGEIIRRALLSAEIPSARARQEIQDLLKIQREQNRLGGLLKKALTERDDAELAVEVMEVLQNGNVRAKGNKTYHLVISFHPEDRRLTSAELEGVVRRAVGAAGFAEHQYIAVRHSEQEHEHLHVAVNKIHPETLKIHHPYKAIPGFQALSSVLERELGLHRVDRTPGRPQSHRARDFEAHRSIGSFPGWARRTIGDAMGHDRITSWPALHDELARFGVRLVRRGNGLAIVDATRPNLACKASALGREWSKQRLCERSRDRSQLLRQFAFRKTMETRALKRKLAVKRSTIQRTWHPGTWRHFVAIRAAERAAGAIRLLHQRERDRDGSSEERKA